MVVSSPDGYAERPSRENPLNLFILNAYRRGLNYIGSRGRLNQFHEVLYNKEGVTVRLVTGKKTIYMHMLRE